MKSKTLKIRVSDDEKRELATMAGACRMPVATFVKAAAMRQQIKPVASVPEINIKTYAALGKIGTNINQVATALNNGRINNEVIEKLLLSLTALSNNVNNARREVLGVNE